MDDILKKSSTKVVNFHMSNYQFYTFLCPLYKVRSHFRKRTELIQKFKLT